MRYTPKQYADAFVALSKECRSSADEKELVSSFTRLIERNGDISRRSDILRETDKALRREHGKRTVMFETARKIEGLEKKFKKFIQSGDVVEERVDPSLVAGVRITVDDENQFDGTFARKLQVLFS